MTTSRANIYFIAGIGMIVGAFFAGAKTIGVICALIFLITNTDFLISEPSDTNNMVNAIFASQATELIHAIGSFLILLFGGLWMLRGPKLLDRWADHNKPKE